MFLQILSGNCLSHVVNLNDLCHLENEVKVTKFELGLRLALVLLCTNLVRIDQIFFQILSGNNPSYVVALNDLCDLKE